MDKYFNKKRQLAPTDVHLIKEANQRWLKRSYVYEPLNRYTGNPNTLLARQKTSNQAL